jgi:hypothetical protein
MAAPTTAACVKKALANPEPSHMAHSGDAGQRPRLSGVVPCSLVQRLDTRPLSSESVRGHFAKPCASMDCFGGTERRAGQQAQRPALFPAYRHCTPVRLSRCSCSCQFGRASAPMITTSGTVLRQWHRSLPERHQPGLHRFGCRRGMSSAHRIK